MQILGTFAHWLVVVAGPWQIQQFALAHKADLGMLWLNQTPLVLNGPVQLFF